MKMRGDFRLCTAALLCAAASACTGGEAALVRGEPQALQIDPDAFDPTKCLSTQCDLKVEPRPVRSERRTCQPEPVDGFEVRWQRYPLQQCPTIGLCSSTGGVQGLHFGPDGSITLATGFSAVPDDPKRSNEVVSGVALVSFGADALDRDIQFLDVEVATGADVVNYAVSLASFDAFHATLGIEKEIFREGQVAPMLDGWLSNLELFAEAEKLSLELAPPREGSVYASQISTLPAGDTDLLVGINDGAQSSFAMLEAKTLEPRWTQSRTGRPPAEHLVVDNKGRVSAVTAYGWGWNAINEPIPVQVEHYNAKGEFEWARSLPDIEGGAAGAIAVDGDGNVIHANMHDRPSPSLDVNPSLELELTKFASDGSTRWAIEIDVPEHAGFIGSSQPVIDDEGTIFVLGPYYLTTAEDGSIQSGMVLYEISADGTDCSSHRVENADLSQLVLGPGGDLYFVGQTVGRLQRR